MSKITTYVMPESKVRIVDERFRFEGKGIKVGSHGSGLDYWRAALTLKPRPVEGVYERTSTGNVNALEYLREAGLFNLKIKTHTMSDFLGGEFSIKKRLGEVDEILSIIDRDRLANDLEEKGYAFLMAKGDPGKFRDYENKGFIANTDRVIQELVYKKIAEELKLDSDVRHFKVQESAELTASDKEYKKIIDNYWINNLEIVQGIDEKKISYKTKNDDNGNVEMEVVEASEPVEVSGFTSKWHHPPEVYYGDDLSDPANRYFWVLLKNMKHGELNHVAALKKVEPRKVA